MLVSGAVEVSIADQILVLPAVEPYDHDFDDKLQVHATNHALWKKHSNNGTRTSANSQHHSDHRKSGQVHIVRVWSAT